MMTLQLEHRFFCVHHKSDINPLDHVFVSFRWAMSLLTHTWGSLAYLQASSLQPQESRKTSISCILLILIPPVINLKIYSE